MPGARDTATAGGEVLGAVALTVLGAHNVVNSLAAVAVGLDLGVGFDESFHGESWNYYVSIGHPF